MPPMDGSRSSLSSNERLPSPSHYEDSTSFSTTSSVFIMDPRSLEPRSADTLTFILQMSACVSEIYREQFLEYVSLSTISHRNTSIVIVSHEFCW